MATTAKGASTPANASSILQSATAGKDGRNKFYNSTASRQREARQREAVLLSVVLHGTLFGLMSGGCFLLLGWLCWRAYGQAFLHHLSRQDHRCDVLVVLLLLWTLSCLLEGKAASAAAAYGLAVHMRIYPIIYAPSIVLFLAARSLLKQQQLRRGKAVAAAAGAGTAQAGAAGGEAAAAKEEVSEATANLQAVSREGPGAEEVEGRAAVESPDHEGEGTQAAQPPRGPHLVPGAAPDTLSQDPDRGAGQEGLLGDKGGGEGRVEEGAGQASGPPNTLHQAGAPAVADAGPMATGNRGSASTGSLNSTAAKASSHPAAGPVPISQPTASQGCKAAWRPPPLTLASQPLRQREAVLLSVLLHGTLFGLMSGGCFLLLGWLCWRAYGQAFLDQAFMHHLSRQDHRHNFSIYFYDIYLSYAARPPPMVGGAGHAAAQPQAAGLPAASPGAGCAELAAA
ncbi:T-complex protein 1 subunit gamma [Haematococcus lacustris]|uniref:GPI mannosyltransferase 1 n=1 Tax=Haematococcus lacustris TaxID=44745 RepID=A0A699YXE8_HAELA|nr:T-complex protein 1 subunit gamma [Haematococcus lacustris]